MSRRTPGPARFLGLWTAGWLFVLLLLGVLRFGDLRVQWPVLLIPLLWALVALRPRRGSGEGRQAQGRAPGEDDPDADDPDADDDPGWYRDDLADEPRTPGPFPPQRSPATREQPWLPDVPPTPRHPRQE